jgi:hypothetical protein
VAKVSGSHGCGKPLPRFPRQRSKGGGNQCLGSEWRVPDGGG